MKKTYLFLAMLAVSVSLHAQKSKANAFSWDNLPIVSRPSFKADTFNITRYKAMGNGTGLNTNAINNAINDCNKQGGGVVLIPAGIWLSGPIHLKNNVNLCLSQGALLLFTTDKSQYKLVEGDYEGKRAARNQSPINGNDLENIAITGKGTIDGNGDAWRAVSQSQLTSAQWKDKVASGGVLSDDKKTWYPSVQFKQAVLNGRSMLLQPGANLSTFADMKDFLRPNLLVLKNCKKVLVEGVTFQNSPAWCLHPLLCEDLTVSGITVKNPQYAQNGDGIDIESCKRFIVEHSILDVGDDAICIKSGKDEEGRKRGIPCAEGIIRSNTVYSGHGAVVIGSEMSGGAKDIFIENCVFLGTDKGLRFKSTRGRGGVVENIFARNIVMKDIVQEAIFFDMFYFVKFATDGKRENLPIVNEGTPIFRNMIFDNITCNGAKTAFFVRGLSEMKIQGITLNNSTLVADTGVELTDASDIKFNNVQLFIKRQVPLFSITNGTKIALNKVSYNSGLPTLLSLDGDKNSVNVLKTDLKSTIKVLDLKNGALENSVSYR